VKRTDLGCWGVGWARWGGLLCFREVLGEVWAAAKSGARRGSLGWVMVELGGDEAEPWNWEWRSLYWVRRGAISSATVVALLRRG
jgi:hypothetical protein